MRRFESEKKDPRIFCDHDSPAYRTRLNNMSLNNMSENRWNGAYYYSTEIVKNIIPAVRTDRPWVTINVPGQACDRAIVFVHNNLHPENYDWLRKYKDLILVCGVPETVSKVSHLGHAVYLPLSVDVREVMTYKLEEHTREVAFVGRRAKRFGVSFPEGTDYLEGLPRPELLKRMAQYKAVYAVGRTAIEAKILGCNVLPYDERFPDPDIWQPVDNSEAAAMLQGLLDMIDLAKVRSGREGDASLHDSVSAGDEEE